MPLVDQLSPFWQGVLGTILTGVVFAIAKMIWSLVSSQAKARRQRTELSLTELRRKMHSADSILRVEGYFAALFRLLKFLFIASIVWVIAWAASLFTSLVSIPIAIGSLLAYYQGLRWLVDITKPASDSSADISGNVLRINSAKYGGRGQYIDVAPVLRERLSDGQIEVYAGNQLAGDPCPNAHKELLVEYTYEGRSHQRSVQEGEILRLP